jgi:hypothetical protein
MPTIKELKNRELALAIPGTPMPAPASASNFP